ncbi:MAG: CDP-alcohol phosphatidyltransferase family protein [Alphaproteobacteria bacterium]|jgi:archaetidylinositol phosphate synthase|nr:CDP-alcohol phosphatidyltransferase family protein [Alphaproteobacteria bacterium]
MAADSDTSDPRAVAYDQRLAKAVVAAIRGLPVSPNALTALGMLVGIISGVLYAEGTRGAMIGGSLLFMVAVWMDHVDGEFARATGKTSRFGHYFDHVAAMTSYCAMFVGAGFGLRDTWLGEWAVPCGIAAGVSVALIFSIRLWQETVFGKETTVQTVRAGFEIEDTLYAVGPITWVGLMPPFVAAAGVGTPIYLIYAIWEAAGHVRRNR